MEDLFDALVGEGKTQKDLLKLVAQTGGVRSDEAADRLKVKRSVIDEWVGQLSKKNYIVAEAQDVRNPLIKPTREFKEAYARVADRLLYREAPETARALEESTGQKESLQAQLEEKERVIEGLKAELIEESKIRAVKDEKYQAEKGAMEAQWQDKAAELERMLERERAERLKLEDLLRRKSAPQEAAKEPAPVQTAQPKTEVQEPPAPETTPRKHEPTAHAITPVEKPQPEEDITAPAPPKDEPAEAWQPQPEPSPDTQKTRQPQLPNITSASSDGKDVTSLVEYLITKGKADSKKAAADIGVDEKVIAEWLKYLEGKGAVEAKRKLLGGSEISLKKGSDAQALIGEIKFELVKVELAKSRGL